MCHGRRILVDIRGGLLGYLQKDSMRLNVKNAVTTIANANTHGISTVLIRALSATGHRDEVRVKKAVA